MQIKVKFLSLKICSFEYFYTLYIQEQHCKKNQASSQYLISVDTIHIRHCGATVYRLKKPRKGQKWNLHRTLDLKDLQLII